MSLAAVNVLCEVGTDVRLTLGKNEDSGERIIVIHSEEDIHQAFVDHCTHNGKELYYLHEEKVLRCYSGKSHFNLKGQVIKGPTERGLQLFPTHRVGDELVIEI